VSRKGGHVGVVGRAGGIAGFESVNEEEVVQPTRIVHVEMG
jgi:hypothetical protein